MLARIFLFVSPLLILPHISYATPLNNGAGAMAIPQMGQISRDPSGFSLEAVKLPRSSHFLNISGRDVNLDHPIGIEVGLQTYWYVQILAGTPPQPILVQPDTGAPDFSLMSTPMPPAFRGNAPVYDVAKSTTYQQVPGMTWYESCASWAYEYTGIVATDVIKIGTLKFTNFQFGVVQTSKTVAGGPPYGTFGLNIDPNGMPTKPTRTQSWFTAVMQYLNQPIFTFDFHKNTSTGVIDFDFIDSKKYTGDIAYAPVTSNTGFWDITISGIAVGKTFYAGSFDVIVDTGATGGITFPRWANDLYFAHIKAAVWNSTWNRYAFPCSSVLPPFVFGIGKDTKVTIPTSRIGILGRISEEPYMCIWEISSTEGQVGWQNVVIEALFVVFDYGNQRVGFANKAE